MTQQPTPDPIAYGPTGYTCGCGKPAHSNLTPCTPDAPATADQPAPYSYTDAQNHRLTLAPVWGVAGTLTGVAGTRHVKVEAEDLTIGGPVTNVWLKADQAAALGRHLTLRVGCQMTDAAGDMLTVTVADDVTTFDVARVPVDSFDGDPATVRVVVLTGRLPEVRRALTAAMGTPDDTPGATP